jgi:hypothetical protein
LHTLAKDKRSVAGAGFLWNLPLHGWKTPVVDQFGLRVIHCLEMLIHHYRDERLSRRAGLAIGKRIARRTPVAEQGPGYQGSLDFGFHPLREPLGRNEQVAADQQFLYFSPINFAHIEAQRHPAFRCDVRGKIKLAGLGLS